MFWLVPPQPQDRPQADSRVEVFSRLLLPRISGPSPPQLPCSASFACDSVCLQAPRKAGSAHLLERPNEMEGPLLNAGSGWFTAPP